MKYKLIASDFDGTLANSHDFISPENVAAVADYIAAGGVFTVSTGRMHGSIMKKIGKLNLGKHGIPIISFQGALVTDSVTGERIYVRPMDKKLVAEIARYCEDGDIYFHTYSADKLFVSEMSELAEIYCKTVHVEEYASVVGRLSDFVENSDEQFIKCLIMDKDRERLEKICDDVNAYFDGRVCFSSSAPFLVECVDNAAGKGNALLHVAERLGIDKADTVAIGDAMNDLSMIRAAGLGCAVGNAAPSLKKEADFIAVTNDEHAVAQIIRLALKDNLAADNRK